MPKNRRLGENIGSAQAGRMLGRLPSIFVGRPSGSPPAAGWRIRRASTPWQKTAGGPEPLLPAAERKERSAPAAAWCRRSYPPWPAKRPSASGIRGGRPHPATPMRPWETRGAASPENQGCPPVLPGCASTPGPLVPAIRSRTASRSSLPFLVGQTSSRRGLLFSSVFIRRLLLMEASRPARLDRRDEPPPSNP